MAFLGPATLRQHLVNQFGNSTLEQWVTAQPCPGTVYVAIRRAPRAGRENALSMSGS